MAQTLLYNTLLNPLCGTVSSSLSCPTPHFHLSIKKEIKSCTVQSGDGHPHTYFTKDLCKKFIAEMNYRDFTCRGTISPTPDGAPVYPIPECITQTVIRDIQTQQ